MQAREPNYRVTEIRVTGHRAAQRIKWIIAIATLAVASNCFAQTRIVSDIDAAKYVGQQVSVKGRVANVYVSAAGNTFLNFGVASPAQTFTAVIFSQDSPSFTNLGDLQGRTVTVSGIVTLYQGKPQIVLKHPSQLGGRE